MKTGMVLALGFAFFAQACSEGSFSGDNSKPKPRSQASDVDGDGQPDGGAGGSSSSNADGGTSGGGVNAPNGHDTAGPGDEIFGGDGSSKVPQNCRDQRLLILDFKSGWWEVQGVQSDFLNMITEELRSRSCAGGTADVEYHHILKKNKPARFYDKDFKVYTQVWILSGTPGDPGDIADNDPGLMDVISQLKANKTNLFIGAGFGSIIHGNAVARGVWGVDIFRADFVSNHSVVANSTGSNVTVKSTLAPRVKDNLFTGVTGQVADHVQVGPDFAASDEIITGALGLTILADCQSDPRRGASRTYACVGIADHNEHWVVVDSGIQRFYAIPKASEEATKTYFRNILRALSL